MSMVKQKEAKRNEMSVRTTKADHVLPGSTL